MSKDIKKRKYKKCKSKSQVKRKKNNIRNSNRIKKNNSVKNVKLFNIDKLKHNFAVLKLVSFIGIETFFGIQSHEEEIYNEEVFEDVGYTKQISNLNVDFNKFYQISHNNLVVRLNSNESINNKNILEIKTELENEEDIYEETEEDKMLKYKDAMKVLEMNEPSLCGMKLSRDFEKVIIDIANRYGFDPKITLTLGNIESDGKWDNNGKISGTNDYGVFQINGCNHQHIEEVFGYSSDDLRYDPIKNAEAAAYLISKIMLRNDVNSLDEIFGMYNGWTNWRNIEGSVNYVNECHEIMNTYFPNYTYDNNKELLKIM